MALSKIKEEYKGTLVVFKNSAKCTLPLGQHPAIDELAIMAQRSGSNTLKEYFEYLPPLEDLLQSDVERQLQQFRTEPINTALPDGATKENTNDEPQNKEATEQSKQRRASNKTKGDGSKE